MILFCSRLKDVTAFGIGKDVLSIYLIKFSLKSKSYRLGRFVKFEILVNLLLFALIIFNWTYWLMNPFISVNSFALISRYSSSSKQFRVLL